MSRARDFTAGTRAVAEAIRAASDDPADQVRLLTALAGYQLPRESGSGPLGMAIGIVRRGTDDLCRRAALASLARAVADYQPRSYDEALALRDSVCGLLADEELVAADAFQTQVAQALRTLRLAVARDLSARAATLARLRTVESPAPASALVLAHRLYGDATRAEELLDFADAPHPLFMPRRFTALTG